LGTLSTLSAGVTIEAIIWDFGGVLTSSPFEAFRRYEIEKGLPENFIRGVNSVNPDTNAWAQIEQARIDATTFDALFLAESRALGHDVSGNDVLALLSGDLRVGTVAALKALRKDYKVGCITNNVPAGNGTATGTGTGTGTGMAETAEKAAAISKVLAQFHHVLESSKIGIRKPDPRIYALMCKALMVEPKACVYLDDLGINLKPARQMGMTTIKVETEAQLLADLGAVLGRDIGAQ
jgi:putative hydrolase of the HAD superfamily